MPKKSTAPAQATTQDDELPQTAVKVRGKDAVIQSLQEQLQQYAPSDPDRENQTEVAEPQTTNNEEDTFKKRYGDLRRHMQQKEANFTKKIGDLEGQIGQLSQLANQPMPSTKEEFEAWKAKYPQIASFIEIIADEKASQRAAQLQEELTGVKLKLTETEKEKAWATLKVLVPDIETVVKSEPYRNWLSDQPEFVQEELNTSDDPHRIAYWINIYRIGTKKPVTNTPAKEDKLGALDTSVKGAGPTPGNTSGKWKFTQSQIAAMSPQEFEKREAEIITARNSGQIMDDVSKHNHVFDL